MTKRVSDLAKKELDYWVARAQGWELIKLFSKDGWILSPDDYEGISKWFLPDGEYINNERWIKRGNYTPSTNGGQAMELVKEYNMTVEYRHGLKKERIWQGVARLSSNDGVGVGPTPEMAICRAVIASHYGDEVPDDE